MVHRFKRLLMIAIVVISGCQAGDDGLKRELATIEREVYESYKMPTTTDLLRCMATESSLFNQSQVQFIQETNCLPKKIAKEVFTETSKNPDLSCRYSEEYRCLTRIKLELKASFCYGFEGEEKYEVIFDGKPLHQRSHREVFLDIREQFIKKATKRKISFYPTPERFAGFFSALITNSAMAPQKKTAKTKLGNVSSTEEPKRPAVTSKRKAAQGRNSCCTRICSALWCKSNKKKQE